MTTKRIGDDFHRFEVDGDWPGCNSKVLMDGKPLKGVREVKTKFNYKGVPEITITMIAGDVDIDIDKRS